MTRNRLYLLLFMLLASCSDGNTLSDDTDAPATGTPPLSLQVATRSTGGVEGEELQTKFVDGTTIGIVSGGKHYAYTCNAEGRLTAVKDWVVFEQGAKELGVEAFYPYRNDGTYTTLHVWQNQNTTTGGESRYYLSDALHARGSTRRADNRVDLTFHHTMSKLVFNVAPDDNAPAATITSVQIENQPLSADFAYNEDGSVNAVTNISAGSRQAITAYQAADGGGPWRAIIIPQSSMELVLTVTTSEDSETKNYKATLTARNFEWGKQYAYTISLKSTLSVTAITAWEDGGNAQEVESERLLPGSGTQEDPYQVASFDDFKKIKDRLNAHYKQTGDIDMENTSFDGIAGGFRGVYDGGSYNIANVNISGEAYKSGLFNQNYGTLKNIKVTGGSVVSKRDFGGAICGANEFGGLIEGCTNAATVTAKSHNVGGICGWNFGTINQCANSGRISTEGSWNEIGGINGRNSGGVISNCTNIGSVTGSGQNHGPINGKQEGTIINCTPADQNTQ